MNQTERRIFLIRELLQERREYREIAIPKNTAEQKDLLRGLMNVREAAPVSKEFLDVQDAYLQQIMQEKGIVRLEDTERIGENLYLWQGDITRLAVDAIVNAANSGMTGCYRPCHNCIDNCIHTFAGVQLRSYCADMMEKQGYEEPTGQAKITPAYNLPCRYVIHTVGPIVQGRLTKKHEELLSSCYRSCLKLADENKAQSIAFCCISTGVFGYPQKKAAETAIQTVRKYREETGSQIKVVFNVFKDEDLEIYRRIMYANNI